MRAIQFNLFSKVFSVALALTIVTAVLLSGFFIHHQTISMQENLENKGKTLLTNLVNNSEFGLVFEDVNLLDTLVSDILQENDVIYASVKNESNTVSISRFADSQNPVLPANVVTQDQTSERLQMRSYTDPATGEEIYHLSAPIFSDSQSVEDAELNLLGEDAHTGILDRHRIGTAHIGMSLQAMHNAVRAVENTIFLLTAIVIVVATLLSILLSALITRPIRSLVAATETLSKGGFDVDVNINTQDEIGELATAFKHMTAQLRETTVSKDYVDDILSTMTDSMVVLSPEHTIETVNQALCTMLGYDERDLIGQPFTELLVDKSGIRTMLYEDSAIDSIIRSNYRTKNGKSIPVVFSGAVMRDASGAITGIVCMAQDITELARTEHELMVAKDLAESANRSKSKFLANMSHELRTPLNAILGYAQVLLKGDQVSEKHTKSLQTIKQSGEHLLSLINEILDLSKIEAGKMELNKEAFSLSGLCNQLESTFSVRAKEKCLSFTFEEVFELPDFVVGDEKKLRQVLMNLLGNALKFTESGGVVLKVGFDEDLIRFQVEDTGCGIDTDRLVEVFQSFRQLKTDRIAEGTGLGLPISKSLVELMGGNLQVKSETGNGSVFWFDVELPVTDAPACPGLTAEKGIAGYLGSTKRVLIVDDKAVNRDVLGQMLAPLGFETLDAVDGEDGIIKAKQFEPHLILMDLRMPGLGGLDAIRAIRRLAFGSNTKIIAISASAFKGNRDESVATGADDFLPKPIQEDVLLSCIQRQLQLEWRLGTDQDTHEVAGQKAPNEMVLEHNDHKILMDFAMRGNVDAIRDYAEKLKTLNEAHTPMADQLKDFAHGFKIKEIQNLLRGIEPRPEIAP